MIAELAPAVSSDDAMDLPQLAVEVVYDAKNQTVTYRCGTQSGNPLTLPLVTEPTLVVVTLAGDPTSFSSFNFDPKAWSNQLVTSFTVDTLQIAVPPALLGNFKFTPQITGSNDGPGSITLQAATTGAPPLLPAPPSPQFINVTFDSSQKNSLAFNPDSVSVPKNQDATIFLTSATPGLTFQGFLPALTAKGELSAWPAAMTVTLTGDTITIHDPSATQAGKGKPIFGTFGFSLAWNFKDGSTATRNPDPTIFNEPT